MLHENMAQVLAAMRLHLSSLHGNGDKGGIPDERLTALDELVGNAFVLLRQIAIELHPLGLDGKSLYSALRALIRSLSERHEIEIKLIFDESELDIGRSRCLTVFRIAQNALEVIAQRRQGDDVLIKLCRKGEKMSLTIDCTRVPGSGKRIGGSPSDMLDELRAQVKEAGGRMRVIRTERGERMEISLPRFSADLQ